MTRPPAAAAAAAAPDALPRPPPSSSGLLLPRVLLAALVNIRLAALPQLHSAGGATSPPVFAQVASLGRVVSVSSCAGASGDAFEVAVDVDAELRRPSVEPPAAPPAFV